jgi:hypothetical protein
MAAGAMKKALLSCVVAAAVLTAANAWSAGRERPELRAALESANAPIEQMPPAPALQGAAAIPDRGPAAAKAIRCGPFRFARLPRRASARCSPLRGGRPLQ